MTMAVWAWLRAYSIWPASVVTILLLLLQFNTQQHYCFIRVCVLVTIKGHLPITAYKNGVYWAWGQSSETMATTVRKICRMAELLDASNSAVPPGFWKFFCWRKIICDSGKPGLLQKAKDILSRHLRYKRHLCVHAAIQHESMFTKNMQHPQNCYIWTATKCSWWSLNYWKIEAS